MRVFWRQAAESKMNRGFLVPAGTYRFSNLMLDLRTYLQEVVWARAWSQLVLLN